MNRILIVLPTAVLGGAERVMFNLADFLLSEGHQVTLYAMSRGEQVGWEALARQPGFKMVARRFKSEKTSLLSFVVGMATLSRRENFDYVISSHTHVNAALSFLRRLRILRCKYLISRESTFVFERFFGLYRAVMWSFYKFFYGAQDLLICQTDHMRESLISNLRFMPVRSIVSIPNPISASNIGRLLAEVDDLESGADKLVVACGRLIPIKGFDMLIRAFALVAEGSQNVSLLIIGDGPERVNLEALINELGLGGRVKLLGRLSNPIAWFARAEVGVVCSVKEGFPNVLIEMMAAGTKRIISTPCSDGVLDLPNVDVVAAHHEKDMAEALRRALLDAEDRSVSYREHIREKRTVASFWDVVQSNCSREAV